MKKMLLAAVAASAVLASPAMAAGNATYDVTGTVSAVCSVSTGTTITFGTSLTGTDGAINASATTGTAASDLGAYCNGANSTLTVSHATLKLQAGGSDSAVVPPTGFVKVIDFIPQVKVGDVATVYTSGTATVGAFSGLTVQAITPSVTSGKPLAGDYKGSITIAVSPSA